MISLKKVGFLINPIAGMGGAVGLKGTDGLAEEARRRGAKPVATHRAETALKKLLGLDALFFTASGKMGESALRRCGLEYQVVCQTSEESSAEDTKKTCRSFLEKGADLVVFCGGDGTARNVSGVIRSQVPIIGIPAGVKMHSGVFTISPQAAGELIRGYLEGDLNVRETEIVDVDEEKYRAGTLDTKIYGIAATPYKPALVQERKQIYSASSEEEFKEEIAIFASEFMRDGSAYILGAGTTTAKIAEVLRVEKTLLGVDVVKDGRVICTDASEEDLLGIIDEVGEIKIIVSPIGAQGFVLGRGSQQISPKVLRKVGPENLIIVATPHKLKETPRLLVETGDFDLDETISGRRQVICGYRIAQLKDVEASSRVGMDQSGSF
ncbi:ATP-NAD kinase family protein [Methanotrichaceae archaeon M04Ac]|uniref:ATP-NAD kinase family protein n=1 Tax=Candidatus Methanocrinis alkalitolerans TaxID=3033395 RepID=A0ABT5XCN2_9EURY|nr:ATP-NAD kinase family protein [Candidatus Methanocrinis alkalitolerans]MCR3884205.1 ATP-NAD kinase family protein [Methanothrix sp.]MDF0592470.1 ATP-NAD kinase family protein [Candidatus Methanocrinis alkalitolerans]